VLEETSLIFKTFVILGIELGIVVIDGVLFVCRFFVF
jgi:hypothetical protein